MEYLNGRGLTEATIQAKPFASGGRLRPGFRPEMGTVSGVLWE